MLITLVLVLMMMTMMTMMTRLGFGFCVEFKWRQAGRRAAQPRSVLVVVSLA